MDRVHTLFLQVGLFTNKHPVEQILFIFKHRLIIIFYNSVNSRVWVTDGETRQVKPGRVHSLNAPPYFWAPQENCEIQHKHSDSEVKVCCVQLKERSAVRVCWNRNHVFLLFKDLLCFSNASHLYVTVQSLLGKPIVNSFHRSICTWTKFSDKILL